MRIKGLGPGSNWQEISLINLGLVTYILATYKMEIIIFVLVASSSSN